MRMTVDGLVGLLRPTIPPQKTTRLSGRQVAERNEFEALAALRLFGHLRAAEVAAAVWPTATYAEQLAQRVLRRLLIKCEVLQRINTHGTPSYVLGNRGVARLRLHELAAQHGRDIVGIAGATFAHRTLASAYLISRASSGCEVFGEYAINHGYAPVGRERLVARFRKFPDGLVLCRDGPSVVTADWIEAECSAKPLEQLKAVLRIANRSGDVMDDMGRLRLGRLVVLFDSRHAHGKRILRAANELWGHLALHERKAIESRIALVAVEVRPPLRIVAFHEQSVAERRQASDVRKGCYT